MTILNPKIITKLQELSKDQKYSVVENFPWAIPSDSPIALPQDLQSNYDKNIYLKENYKKSGADNLKNRFWLIQKWGGIAGFKESIKNNNLLKVGGQFEQELLSKNLSKDSFRVISSLSKVASFIDYKNYAIYDSRAIFALNWLLFKYGESNKFFPQPLGRNTLLSQYNLHTIFNISGREFSYYAEEDAYHQYCNLLKKLSKAVYNQDEPYHIEMLLFILATEFVINKNKTGDIKDSLTLVIK